MFHSDNCYYLENVSILSFRCKTNTVSNTAFRGFGGPQGMMGIECVIDEIARHLGKDPLDVRKLNFYGIADRNVTHYHQPIVDNVIHDIVAQLHPGVIIGMHDGPIDTPAGAATIEAVGRIIDTARALGYCFGVVSPSGQVT